MIIIIIIIIVRLLLLLVLKRGVKFHYIYSNSTQFHLVVPIPQQIYQYQFNFFTYYFLPRVSTLKYLLLVVYIPNRIVMEEIFLN